MIEKFLEKFLPQITERLNENEEVGKALIEALAVLDNYATINNVQFTDEQVNNMLGVVPEPAPEPNADIPAEIVEIVEKKKRGRKPKAATTAQPSTWDWRFKTEEEFKEEYGDDWREEANWSVHGGMDYLLGEQIAETSNSRDVINLLKKLKGENYNTINTFRELGISSGDDDDWVLQFKMLTNKPLPTALTPTTWNWRFKTEQELEDDLETGDGSSWREKLSFPFNMDYLLGQPIKESLGAITVINELVLRPNDYIPIETQEKFGISSPRGDNDWRLNFYMITNLPLSTTEAPAKSEPKKRGRKPKETTTAWTWRFKTLDEFVNEYGDDWVDKVDWLGDGEMDYLLGQEIAETTESKEAIKELTARTSSKVLNTFDVLGITSGGRDLFRINTDMLINKPLPTATPKKRGRKPKETATAWTWRFKTEQELRGEYGGKPTGSIPVTGSFISRMFYLFGKPIEENDVSKKFIEDLKNEPYTLPMDTKNLGISNGVEDTYWSISFEMITDKPLPTAAAPKKLEPKKRGRKPKSELPEIDLGGLEDIGDIDIDAIDFDNLVI